MTCSINIIRRKKPVREVKYVPVDDNEMFYDEEEEE